MKRKLLLAALFVAFATGGGNSLSAQTEVPFLREKANFGGTTVSSLSTFVPSGTTYTLELTGCAAGTEITVPGGSFSYTPTTGGTIRFVRNGGDVVYVYEGTTYKGTVSVSAPAELTYPDIFAASDDSSNKTGIYSESNLFKNPGFETKGEKLSDHNYKAVDWDCNGYAYNNKSRVRDNAALSSQEGSCTFLIHGYGNPKEYLSQTMTNLNSFTPYKIQMRTWWHDSKSCDYNVTIGTSVGNGSVLSSTKITTPSNNNPKDQAITFTTGALTETSYVFAITRVTDNRLGNFDRMVMVAANGGGIGITGATGATFLSGSAYAPVGAFGAATSYSLKSTYSTLLVTNGTFDSNANEWTTTTGASNKGVANNQSGAFTENFWENWNGSAYTGKMYQSVSDIPNGTYKLNICAFVNTVDANKGQYVYANDNKTYVYTTTPTAYTVYTYVNNNTLEYGLNQTTAVANWMGIDNVSLEYCGSSDVTVDGFQNIFNTTQTTISTTDNLNNATYENVTGSERTNLQNALNATPTATADGYATATFDIGYGDYVFVSAVATYTQLVTEKTNAATLGMTADAIAAATLNTMTGAEAMESLKAAERAFITTQDPGKDITLLLTNPSFEEGDDVWNNGWSIGRNTTYTFDYKYLNVSGETADEGLLDGDKVLNAWAQQINYINVTQNVTLPVGFYQLTASVVSDKIKNQHIAAIANSVTYNSPVLNGSSWQTLSVLFKVGAESSVTLGIYSNGNNVNNDNYGWFKVDNFKLTYYGNTVPATIGSTGYTTFASPYALNFEGLTDVTAYKVSAVSAEEATLTPVTGTVAAGTGLILAGTAGDAVTIPVAESGEAISDNMLVGCTSTTVLGTNSNYYVMVKNGDGEAEFQSLVEHGATIPAGKAYLNAPGLSLAPLRFTPVDDVTGIKNVGSKQAGKGVMYNTAGQQVNDSYKGIVIKDGKRIWKK